MTFIRRPTTRLLKEAKHLVAKLKNWHFVLCHLDLGPMTLILKLDLDMVKINHHKVYVLITSKVIADLYAPQGVDLGEGGSLSYWCDTE